MKARREPVRPPYVHPDLEAVLPKLERASWCGKDVEHVEEYVNQEVPWNAAGLDGEFGTVERRVRTFERCRWAEPVGDRTRNQLWDIWTEQGTGHQATVPMGTVRRGLL